MTTGNSCHREPTPAQRTVPAKSLLGVRAAGRVKPATLPEKRTDQFLVTADQHQQESGHGPTAGVNRRNPASRWAASWAAERSAEPASARTTTVEPAGSTGSRSRTRCRSRRRVRLRATALPTALPTTKPARGGRAEPGCAITMCTTSGPRPARRPERKTPVKSALRRTREAAGSISGRQFRTALGTPGRQDGAARTSAHAQPEAVRLRTTAVVRLVRALHGKLQ